MRLTSPSFAARASIPRQHTCDGDNVSPPLAWQDLPRGTKSLALIAEDLGAAEARGGRRVLWVLGNLQPSEDGLPLGVAANELPAGAWFGANSEGQSRYGGPCPPPGTLPHRYRFRLLALDRMLPDLGGKRGVRELEQEIAGSVLEVAELIGTYERSL